MTTTATQFTIREIDLPRDAAALKNLDASFTTDAIYRGETDENSMRLVEEKLEKPFRKKYDLRQIDRAVGEADLALLAQNSGRTVGFVTVKIEAWNRRAWLTHLYVTPENKGLGIGKALLSEALRFGKRRKARCLWLETQNVNFPAINFYRKMGFRLCGFDDTLYDPGVTPGETALYFSKDI